MPDGARVLLLRHGKTALNGHGRTSVDRIRGWSDIPLDDFGMKEARDIAARLKGEKIDRVLTSDLKRSVQTGAAVAKLHGLKLSPTRAFRPWSAGVLTGRPSTEAVPVMDHYAKQMPDTPIPDGESWNSFRGRVLPAFRRVLAMAKADGETVLIVSHFRTLKLIEAWLDAGGKGTAVDFATFDRNDLKPGALLELTPKGETWAYRVLSRGAD